MREQESQDRAPQCSRCLGELGTEAGIAGCGHAFCRSCLSPDSSSVFTCPIDSFQTPLQAMIQDRRLSSLLESLRVPSPSKSVDFKAIYDLINVRNVPCRFGLSCRQDQVCPYTHSSVGLNQSEDEEDLFQSMVPVFPDLREEAKTDENSVSTSQKKEEDQEDILKSYMNIESEEVEKETEKPQDDFLLTFAHKMVDSIETAYHWVAGKYAP